jgi:hypothetical protein
LTRFAAWRLRNTHTIARTPSNLLLAILWTRFVTAWRITARLPHPGIFALKERISRHGPHSQIHFLVKARSRRMWALAVALIWLILVAIETTLRDLPEGPEMQALSEHYLSLHDQLAEAMAK